MKESSRSGSLVRGAVAAGAATAVLLGGFGAFALWSDSANAGATGAVETGYLELDPISATPDWYLANPGGVASPVAIDLSTFRASPGDVIYYDVPVSGTVKGSDLTAELQVDPTSVAAAFPATGIDASKVDVTVGSTAGAPVQIVGTSAGTAFTETVRVQIDFTEDLEDGMALSPAVSLTGLELTLQQIV